MAFFIAVLGGLFAMHGTSAPAPTHEMTAHETAAAHDADAASSSPQLATHHVASEPSHDEGSAVISHLMHLCVAIMAIGVILALRLWQVRWASRRRWVSRWVQLTRRRRLESPPVSYGGRRLLVELSVSLT